MKCPSRFCNHENPEKTNYCEKYNLDLKMDEKSALFWDGMYAGFSSVVEKDKIPDWFNLKEFHLMMERHPELTYAIGLLNGLKGDKIKTTEQPTNKIMPKTGLYSIFLKRLKKLEKHPNKIIKYPSVFQEIGTIFHMTKEESWDVLFMLNEFGLIEIVKFCGIRLKY